VEFGDGVSAADCIVHDETDPFLAGMLARMDYPEFPVPMGVLYRNPRPTYDSLMNQQLEAVKAQAPTDLQKLLMGNENWTVG
jgi:2-oxoglutarate ferredoxin oxidoreductase subunit beta